MSVIEWIIRLGTCLQPGDANITPFPLTKRRCLNLLDSFLASLIGPPVCASHPRRSSVRALLPATSYLGPCTSLNVWEDHSQVHLLHVGMFRWEGRYHAWPAQSSINFRQSHFAASMTSALRPLDILATSCPKTDSCHPRPPLALAPSRFAQEAALPFLLFEVDFVSRILRASGGPQLLWRPLFMRPKCCLVFRTWKATARIDALGRSQSIFCSGRRYFVMLALLKVPTCLPHFISKYQ